MDTLKSFQRFPAKVELHVHLDGSIEVQSIIDIAKTRGIALPIYTVEGLSKAVQVDYAATLESVLHSFGIFMPVIAGNRDAISKIAYEFCRRCSKDGIVYAETRYSPQLFSNSAPQPEYALESGSLTPRDVVLTINDAFERGSRDFNVTVKSILCCIRHRPDWSLEVASLCKEFREQGVVGIDIASGEFLSRATDPSNCLHRQAFEEAYAQGVHRTAHAGEVGAPAIVYEALDVYRAERVGHGYRSVEDHALYERLKAERVHLETCPISSLKTARARSRTDHPILRFATDEMNFSINTDDPLVFGNTLPDDYEMAREFGLTDLQLEHSIYNAANSCFANEREKKQLLFQLDEVYKSPQTL